MSAPGGGSPPPPSASVTPVGCASMRQPLGPGVLAAQRTDDPQFARRALMHSWSDERAHRRRRRHRAADDCDSRGNRHDHGCMRPAGQRGRAASLDSGSSPPPTTRTALASTPAPTTSTSPRPGTGRQMSRVAGDERRDVRMPRPPPCPLGGLTLADFSADALSRRECLRVGALAVTPGPAVAIEHRRTGDQRS